MWGNGVSGSKVTQAQYDDIVLQQLEELWGNYGSLVEIWYDGGTGLAPPSVDKMVALRQKLQPQAVTFGGCAAMQVNSVAWVGTESGHAPYPLCTCTSHTRAPVFLGLLINVCVFRVHARRLRHRGYR